MNTRASAGRIWTGAVLYMATRVLSASEATAFPNPGPDYVVERIAAVPQTTIRAIVQTRDGYLWLGTYKGLIRFDGVRPIFFDVANTADLSSDAISVLHEDRAGDLWIGTDDGGVIRYRNGEFRAFGPAQGLSDSEVRAISEDRDQKLWIGTRRGLFYRTNDGLALFQTTNLTVKASIYALAPGPDGSLWVGTSEGVFHLQKGIAERLPGLAEGAVNDLGMDAYGVLWAGLDSQRNIRVLSESGSTKVERHSSLFHRYYTGRDGNFFVTDYGGGVHRLENNTNVALIARFEQRQLVSVCEDADGNIWVGPESLGLYRVRRKQVRTIGTAEGLPTVDVTTILEDREGRLWAGTFGRGVYAAENQTTKFNRVPIPKVANVTALLERTDGTLCVGSYNGDLFHRGDSGFVLAHKGAGSRAVYEDHEGGFWVGTLIHGIERHRDGKLIRYTARDGLASDRIQCLIEDPRRDMWVGTLRGLNRISAGKVTRFPGQEVLARKTIRTLHIDQRGALWIGTLGSGLARFYNDRLQIITARHGLPSDSIEQILEDDDGNLWLGTWAGISRVSRAELDACADGQQDLVKAMTLGPEDGMRTVTCGSGFQPSCVKTRAGILWFCTPGGIVIVDPKSIQQKTQPPPVYIEEAAADDHSLTMATNVTVPPGAKRVSFRYTALSFGAPEKVHFRYRLEGFDEEWVNAGVTREATYTRLPPGSYRFRVSAGNKDGVWNTAGAMLGVVVVPPWWRSWWFGAVAIVTLAGIILGAYELRVYQQKKARLAQETFARRLIESQEQERKRVSAELHDSLGQSLQVIKGRAQLGLNRATEPGESAKQFDEISTAASQAIQEVRSISHALRPAELDQLGLAKAIEWMLEKTNPTSATRFACEMEGVERLSPEMEISLYRIAQEGINNVLKHARATEAILQLQREDGVVRFSIFDNGRGFVKTAGPDGHGLSNIAERVRLLGGKFEVQSSPDKGTRLTATLPT